MSRWSDWTARVAGGLGGAGRAGEAGGAGRAGGGWCAHAAVATSAATAQVSLFRNLIERLHHVVEVGRVDFRGARLTRPRHEHVVAHLRECRSILFLP